MLKKKAKIFKAALPFFAFVSVSAQEVKVTYGESFNFPTELRYDIVNDGEGFRIAYLNKKKKLFTFFNIRPDFSLGDTTIEQLHELPKGYEPEFFTHNWRQNFWLYSSADKLKGKDTLFAKSFDFKSGRFSLPTKTILTSDTLVNYIHEETSNGNTYINFSTHKKVEEFYSSDKYRLNQSSDSLKFSIRYTLNPVPVALWDSINTEKYGVVVYDNSFNILWAHVFELTCPIILEWLVYLNSNAKCLRIAENVLLSNKGDVLMLSKKVHEKLKSGYNYIYQILLFTKSGIKPKIITLNSDGKYIMGGQLFENKQGNIFIIGCYGENKDAGTEGIFTYKMDSISSGNFRLHQFSKFTNKINSNKTDSLIKGLKITDVLPANDNGFYVLGEVQLDIFIGSLYYQYDDIYTFRIDSLGKILWMTKVPKHQMGSYKPGKLSFNYILKGDSLYLFYMDNIKMMDNGIGKKRKAYVDGQGGQLFVTILNGNGEVVSKKILIDIEIEEINFNIKNFLRSGNTLINTAYSKKFKYRPMVLIVE